MGLRALALVCNNNRRKRMRPGRGHGTLPLSQPRSGLARQPTPVGVRRWFALPILGHGLRLVKVERADRHMDEATMRGHLKELKKRLQFINEEQEVIVDLIRGYEGWLRLRSAGLRRVPFVPPKPTVRARPAHMDGKLSIRQAVIQTLRDAQGEPIHAKEILRRIRELGVSPNAKEPTGVIDLTCHSLKNAGKPVERTGPRTWRWTEK